MAHQPDVSSTLGDLERKLRDLERELAGGTVADAAAPSAATPPPAAAADDRAFAVEPPTPGARPDRMPLSSTPIAAPAPAPAAEPEAQRVLAEAKASLTGLHRQLDDLARVRQELERSTRELMDEYSRVLSAFGVPDAATSSLPHAAQAAAPPATTAPVPSPVAPPAPPAPSADTAPPSGPGRPPAPDPATPGAVDHVRFSGQVTVDAGPFTDIATLSAFEQALGHVPGTQDVYVRGFEGSRAIIDVVLGEPVALGAELRRTAPVGFALEVAGPQHVSITIDGGPHA